MRFPQVGERMREAPAHALRAMFAGVGQVLLVADRMRSRPAGPDADQPGADERQVQAPRPVAAENTAGRPAAAERAISARTYPADQAGGQLADQAGAQPADQAGGHAPQKTVSRWRSLDETGNVRILPVSHQTRPPEQQPAPAQRIPPVEPGPAERPAVAPAPPEPDIIPPAAAGPIAAEPVPEEPVPAEMVVAEPVVAEPVVAEPTLAEPVPAGTTGPVAAGTTGLAPLPIANYDDLSLASLRARLRYLDSAQLQALLGYEQAHAARPAVLGMFERRIGKLETGQG